MAAAGEPVGQLAGRRVLVAHGTADGITDPQETWAYVERARAVTQVPPSRCEDGDHPMLRRARLWHAIATEFARAALELPAGSRAAGAAGSVAAAVTTTAWEPPAPSCDGPRNPQPKNPNDAGEDPASRC